MSTSARKMALETQAMQEYVSLLGKVVEVRQLSGYVGEDSADFSCTGTKVRICTTDRSDILRWMDDEWLDPVYNVEIVERGGMSFAGPGEPVVPEKIPRSCWIYGTSRSAKTGALQASDMVTVDGAFAIQP